MQFDEPSYHTGLVSRSFDLCQLEYKNKMRSLRFDDRVLQKVYLTLTT